MKEHRRADAPSDQETKREQDECNESHRVDNRAAALLPVTDRAAAFSRRNLMPWSPRQDASVNSRSVGRRCRHSRVSRPTADDWHSRRRRTHEAIAARVARRVLSDLWGAPRFSAAAPPIPEGGP